MRLNIILFVLITVTSCKHLSNKDMVTNNNSNHILLKETAVGSIEGERIGCANIFEREYTLANGKSTTGLSAKLSILSGNNNVIVGKGSEFKLNNNTYNVIEVDESYNGKPFGYVKLEKVE